MTDHTPTPGEQRPTDDTAAVPTAPDESIPATPAADAAATAHSPGESKPSSLVKRTRKSTPP